MSIFSPDWNRAAPKISTEDRTESLYERYLRIFEENRELFSEYLRDYVSTQGLDAEAYQQLRRQPQRLQKLIEELAEHLSHILPPGSVPAAFLADPSHSLVQTLLWTAVTDIATIAPHEHVRHRDATLQASAEAAAHLYDPQAEDLESLRLGRKDGRAIIQGARDAEGVSRPFEGRSLSRKERDEEVEAALRYLDIQSPLVSEWLRDHLSDPFYPWLQEHHRVITSPIKLDEHASIEWITHQYHPEIREAVRTVLENTVTTKVDDLQTATKEYLSRSFAPEDLPRLQAELDNPTALEATVAAQQTKEEAQYQAVRIGIETMVAILHRDRIRNEEGDPALRLLDRTEIHRLATASSLEAVQRFADEALERLDYAYVHPNMAADYAIGLHIPSTRLVIQEPSFQQIENISARVEAALTETDQRISEKRRVYRAVLDACEAFTKAGQAARTRIDLLTFLQTRARPYLQRLREAASVSVPTRVEQATQELTRRIKQMQETSDQMTQFTELTRHTPQHIRTLLDDLYDETRTSRGQRNWSRPMFYSIFQLIRSAEFAVSSVQARQRELGVLPAADIHQLERAERYPGLAWKEKIFFEGTILEEPLKR